MQVVYKILKWSFEALALGKYPYNDHDDVPFGHNHHPDRFAASAGQCLADGFCGAFSEMRGDWKYLKEALGLKEHYGMGQRICHLCGVLKHSENPGMRYSNFRRDAAHRLTRVTNSSFPAAYGALPLLQCCCSYLGLRYGGFTSITCIHTTWALLNIWCRRCYAS